MQGASATEGATRTIVEMQSMNPPSVQLGKVGVWIAAFTVASAAASLAPSVGVLIVARVAQGAGAAIVFPLTLTLISEAFTAQARGAAIGIWAGIAGLAVAGGPVVGGAITERPDLFRAVVIESGLLDLLRFQNTANGVMNVPEFGSTKTLEGFEDLDSVSAYDHVKPDVKYPAVLLEIGMNDPRVDPWQSAKMAARLDADSTSGLPVLLRVDSEAGHALASTAEQKRELFTDEMSFLFWQLGVPGFQPAAPPSSCSSAAISALTNTAKKRASSSTPPASAGFCPASFPRSSRRILPRIPTLSSASWSCWASPTGRRWRTCPIRRAGGSGATPTTVP